MKKKFLLILLLTPFLLFSQPFNSVAIPITGGETTVEITGFTDLFGLGILPIPIGDAQLVDLDFFPLVPTVSFPITGGDITGTVLSIEHDGSGVLLQSYLPLFPNLLLEDFLIEYDTSTESGLLTANGAVPLFDIGADTGDGLPLLLTAAAAGVVSSVFDLDPEINLTGFEFGFAQTSPQTAPVPEPSTIMLLGLGLVGLAGFGRKKLKN